jgi:BirA family biotin operon repressor/biotin-[acetyl-CoA-carboxylase] ligase
MIGWPRVHHAVTDSTNERAKELAAVGAPHGTLVTAAEQTAGRGRQGREWLAPAGSAVLMSVILREFDPLLPLRAAVAVAETVGSEEIKWPNDVWLGGRKVAGILVEGRPGEGWAVLGVGLNVAPVEFPPELDAVALDDGRSVEEVLAALLNALAAWLDVADPLPEWRRRDALQGQTIGWVGGAGGTAAGIDDSGALLVDTTEGQVALQAGEVHLQI